MRDIYITGAITDPKKTDLSFEYVAADGRTHRYTPDFAIHTRDDRWLLVEVKLTARRRDSVEGEDGVKAKALRELEERNPGRVTYHIVFADEVVSQADLAAILNFVAGA